MIVVANRIRVAEGHEEDFERRFVERTSLLQGLPGFVSNYVLRPVTQEPSKAETYVVMTFWENEDSFRAWTRSEAFREAHGNPPPKEMFSGPSQLEIHEVFQFTEAADELDDEEE